jgi:hypothetical protein
MIRPAPRRRPIFLRCIGGDSVSVRALSRVDALRGRMFPNVRFMIAAVVASIVALGGGFALFASFRVSHEPLSRLASGEPPLQLAADATVPSAATGESFGVRFQVIQTQIAGAVAPLPPPPPAPDHDDTIAPPAAATAAVATANPDTSATAPEQPAPVAQAPAAASTAPEAKQDEAAVTPSEAASEPALPPDATNTAGVEPPPEPASAAAPQTAVVESPVEPASPASTGTIAPPADQTPAEPPPPAQQPPTQQADQQAKPDMAASPTAAAALAPPVRHKVVRRTRLAARPRPAAPSSSQQFGVGGPFIPVPNH